MKKAGPLLHPLIASLLLADLGTQTSALVPQTQAVTVYDEQLVL